MGKGRPTPSIKQKKKREKATESLADAMFPTGKMQTVRDLIRKPLDVADLNEIKQNEHLSDRALAIIGAAGIERAVERAILTRLPNLDVPTYKKLIRGPFSSFYTKNHLGFALGVLTAIMRDNLERIREIRNAFAHSPGVISFRTPIIAQACSRLVLAQTFDPSELEHPVGRQQFGRACLEIGVQLEAMLRNKAESIRSSSV
jgi:hypothetical protein